MEEKRKSEIGNPSEIRAEDWELIICRCEEISRGEILRAIQEGARTVEEVKRATRAGMGLCQSRSCLRAVQKILAEETGQALSEITPARYRPPVRPISLGVLASWEGKSNPGERS